MEDGNGILYFNTRNEYSMRDGDLQEEDVWGVMKEKSSEDLLSPNLRKLASHSATTRVTIPRVKNAIHEAKVAQQASAPVNIPDWSKIQRKNSKKGLTSEGSSWIDDDEYHPFVVGNDDDDDDDDEMVPPHEYVARKLSRSQVYSFSMCEGIGRTLKGRDLSKMRNAILTKTGFLE